MPKFFNLQWISLFLWASVMYRYLPIICRSFRRLESCMVSHTSSLWHSTIRLSRYSYLVYVISKNAASLYSPFFSHLLHSKLYKYGIHNAAQDFHRESQKQCCTMILRKQVLFESFQWVWKYFSVWAQICIAIRSSWSFSNAHVYMVVWCTNTT